MSVQLRRGRGWIALTLPVPRALARYAPGPMVCIGLGLTRAARERAREAVSR